MTNRDRIEAALAGKPRQCDDCLARTLGISPRQAVNAECRRLVDAGRLARMKSECVECGAVKITNHPSAPGPRVARPASAPTATRSPATVARAAGVPQRRPHAISVDGPTGWSRGTFDRGAVDAALAALSSGIRSGRIEIYNEFSLQHELGILLREQLPGLRVQFERNVAHFGFAKAAFEKREIDITIFDPAARTLLAAIELKYPRNGQHPEAMYAFCKDVVFAEQLADAGFATAFVVIVADDRLFYEGGHDGIYGYFRGGRPLTGTIAKPTGAGDASVEVRGSYRVAWQPIRDALRCTVIEARPDPAPRRADR